MLYFVSMIQNSICFVSQLLMYIKGSKSVQQNNNILIFRSWEWQCSACIHQMVDYWNYLYCFKKALLCHRSCKVQKPVCIKSCSKHKVSLLFKTLLTYVLSHLQFFFKNHLILCYVFFKIISFCYRFQFLCLNLP